MRHVFVINPKAGKGKVRMLEVIRPQIDAICEKHSLSYEFHLTEGPHTAINWIKARAQGEPTEYFRFYACGGDGTVYEVANGVYGLDNAEFAVIPLGSGNDFVRLFGGKPVFRNLESQVLGEVIDIDVIDCMNGGIAVNQCSMGYDAETCRKQIKYKKYPFVNGEMAYVAAMANRFFFRMGEDFEVEIDGVRYDRNGKQLLLCAIANSRWYGGGFMIAPRAMPDDGYLDCCIVTMKKNKFQMMPMSVKIRKGEHLEADNIEYIRCKKLKIIAPRESAVNIDGEMDAVFEANFEIREKALKFVLPKVHTLEEVRAKWAKEEQEKPVPIGL